jgi:pSer/pThr/pTyr-binding forkhead associated (FHA) protein
MDFINNLIWIVPLTLLILIIVQIVFLISLRYAPVRAKAPAPRPMPPRTASPGAPSSSPLSSAQPSAARPSSAPLPPPPPIVTTAPAGAIPTTRPTSSETSAEAINKFAVLSGLQGAKEIRLPSKDFRIGRYYNLEGNILVGFDEKSVSRKHAQLTLDYERREYYLTDTDSSYGTYLLVEGATEQLTPRDRKRVYNGDVIRFGNVVTVRLSVIGETRASTTRL